MYEDEEEQEEEEEERWLPEERRDKSFQSRRLTWSLGGDLLSSMLGSFRKVYVRPLPCVPLANSLSNAVFPAHPF